MHVSGHPVKLFIGDWYQRMHRAIRRMGLNIDIRSSRNFVLEHVPISERNPEPYEASHIPPGTHILENDFIIGTLDGAIQRRLTLGNFTVEVHKSGYPVRLFIGDWNLRMRHAIRRMRLDTAGSPGRENSAGSSSPENSHGSSSSQNSSGSLSRQNSTGGLPDHGSHTKE